MVNSQALHRQTQAATKYDNLSFVRRINEKKKQQKLVEENIS